MFEVRSDAHQHSCGGVMRDQISTAVAARGRWPRIMVAFGVPKKILTGRNGPCLFCGGKDRARFTDYDDEGHYVCTHCGNMGGFKFLMKFKGWSFRQVADEIDKILGTNYRVSMSKENLQQMRADEAWEHRVHKSTRDCAEWLAKKHPEKLEEWLDSHHPEVRFWWESRND